MIGKDIVTSSNIRYELWLAIENQPFNRNSTNWFFVASFNTAEEALNGLEFEKEMDAGKARKYFYVIQWVEQVRTEGFLYSEVIE